MALDVMTQGRCECLAKTRKGRMMRLRPHWKGSRRGETDPFPFAQAGMAGLWGYLAHRGTW
jgi:hypothetical protein